ncbi:MAG TPA: cytochrome c oxidase subunit 4 [Candidatus Limnocylindrales bacterium]|nr:cytochrome c oxidase subunit 4 [Candidatus Limnocylindrales bacterium]
MRFPEEARFFGRSAVFALVIAVVYWFVSYEWAGSVLLFGFGLASAVMALFLGRAAAGQVARRREADPGDGADGPFGDESGPIPNPTFAPIVFAAGLALVALGLAFGPWLFLAAVMPIVLGATSWLGSANAEWRGQQEGDR